MNKTIDNITLLRGDCLEILPTLADESVDAVICDLPYGTTACKWDVVIPFEPLWKEFKRIVKPYSAIVLFASQPFTSALVMSNANMFRSHWVWDKKFGANFANWRTQPMKIHEDIVVFSKERIFYKPQKTKREKPIKKGGNKGDWQTVMIAHPKPEYIGKVYEYKLPESIIHISSRSEKRGLHPTQKPVALLEYLIKTYTNEGDCVLDCTMGSGSTMVACTNTGRRGIGIELMQEYYDIAVKRVKDAQAQLNRAF